MEKLLKNIQEDCKKSCTNISLLEPLKSSTILVTGGTGFMGKWLSEMIIYLNENFSFNIKLILLARDIEKFKMDVPHIAKKQFISFLEQDIRNLYELPDSINFVIHAAGSPDSNEHFANPIKSIETFVKGTSALLETSFRLPNLKKIVHISSHQIYGSSHQDIKIDENFQGTSDCYNLLAIYREAKRISETYCAIYRNQYRLPIVIARPFAFIGPYQSLNKNWALNCFLRDAINNDPIRILGDEKTVRSYMYGSDMAFWLLAMLSSGENGECFNLGSPEGISFKELADKIKTILNSDVDIVSKASKEIFTTTSFIVPDVSKAQSKLKLNMTYSLEDSIHRTIEWNTVKEKAHT